MAGLLDYTRSNPWVGDTLQTLAQGLLSVGTNNPELMNQIPLLLQHRQDQRYDRSRQGKLDAQNEQLFKLRLEEAERTANKDKAAQQAFQGLLNPVSDPRMNPANRQPGLLADYSPEQQAYIKTLGATDPSAAMNLIGGDLFREADDSAPKTVGGMMWDPQAGTYVPIPGYTEQQAAIAAAGRNPVAGSGAEYGLAPFYVTDPQSGQTKAFQLSKSGGMQEIPLPEGFVPAPQTQYLDTGTAFVPMDKRTGQGVAEPVVKDVAGAASEKAVGEGQGKALVDLPNVENNARYIKETLTRIKEHPGRERGTGASSVLDPRNYIPGTIGSDFEISRQQLQGQAFLQAFEGLKGGGQITEAEGAAATRAKARLDAAQSDEEFVKALDEFSREVDKLVELANKKARGSNAPSASPTLEDPLGIR